MSVIQLTKHFKTVDLFLKIFCNILFSTLFTRRCLNNKFKFKTST